MKDENVIIESREVTKDIFNRLNDSKRKILIIDCFDNSKIAVDDVLLDIICNYYKNKLL